MVYVQRPCVLRKMIAWISICLIRYVRMCQMSTLMLKLRNSYYLFVCIILLFLNIITNRSPSLLSSICYLLLSCIFFFSFLFSSPHSSSLLFSSFIFSLLSSPLFLSPSFLSLSSSILFSSLSSSLLPSSLKFAHLNFFYFIYALPFSILFLSILFKNFSHYSYNLEKRWMARQ